MIKLTDLLKEIFSLAITEYNKSQLDYIAQKINTEKDNKFISLMNKLDSQGIKYNDLKDKILNNQIKSLTDLEQLKTVSKSSKEQDDKISGSEKIFENDTFLIVNIKSLKASCAYGAGTKWCTTGDDYDSKEMLRGYTMGKNQLYYIIDKTKDKKDPEYKVAYTYEEHTVSAPIGGGKFKSAMDYTSRFFNAIDDKYYPSDPEFKKYVNYMSSKGVPVDKIFPILGNKTVLKDPKFQQAYDNIQNLKNK